MINKKELIDPETVEFFIPFSNNALQFITIKGWDGQALKLNIDFFRQFLENYMRITVSENIRRDKKAMKKILDWGVMLKKFTDFGIIYIIYENYKGGYVYIGQKGSVQELENLDFKKDGWNKLEEILIFSKKDQLRLSLRTAIEAKILKEVMNNEKFRLLNNKRESEEKIKLSEFQLEDLDVKLYYNKIKLILTCLGISLLK
ncbi:MAG TPA: hypothetical protein ENI51_03410 [Candidatus Atribacteria bacterium]|nr:hypothetical protein [Candidatus Atribacteria bacterium]